VVLDGMTYSEWIERYVASQKERFVRGKCASATKAMVEAFPELRRAAGFVHCTWGREEHWWCVAPDGSVVDPTVEQFEAVARYEELDLSDPKTRSKVPTGRCLNCGGAVYAFATFCDEDCERDTEAYLQKECL
jgi:hypothetical protein